MGIRARIAAIAVAGDVRRIRLACDAPFSFDAGQYLFIVHPSGRRIPFSIASSPHRLPELELHFRPIPGNEEAVLVTELLGASAELLLDGPHGDVHVGSVGRPLWLYAGGTGISQALSMISSLTARPAVAPVQLVWSVVTGGDLYCETELREFERIPWFRMTTLVDSPGDTTNAAVRHIEREGPPPDDATIVLCGGPGFVNSVADALASRGVQRARIRSDTFTYASGSGV